MHPSELCFSLHNSGVVGERPHCIIAVICPIKCWDLRPNPSDSCGDSVLYNEQIGDYDQDLAARLLPDGFEWLIGHEEDLFITDKSEEEARQALLAHGYVERTDMKKFLDAYWR